MHTKAAKKMPIRRQLNAFKELVKEYELNVDMTLDPSTQNIANQLTRVLQWWFDIMKKENGLGQLIGAVHVNELEADQTMSINRSSGHLGVRHTTYFKSAIWMCKEYQSIDPAPVH